MKRNDIKALADKKPAELEKQLSQFKADLTKAYLEKNARQLKNTALIKNLKADIARVKTVLTAKKKEVQE